MKGCEYMSEINAFMNGYKPEGDNEFLVASLETHKKALVEANLETETAKEFLYQHIQTNKELEKKVEDFKETASLFYKEMISYKQKVERLEKALKDIKNVSTLDEYEGAKPKSLLYGCYEIAKQALETEGEN
jgi:predicted RNase H-like nuclease (RuvC/YqgF family)